MPSFYDLMKYARTGIASPDMTGFDKMRALAAFGGGKTQTLTGIPPLSFNSNGTPLISWSMLGNGSQTGTPTPDNPIMPTFCGVRTGNLFYSDRTNRNTTASSTIDQTEGNSDLVITKNETSSAVALSVTINLPLQAGTYTLSIDGLSVIGGNLDRLNLRDSDGVIVNNVMTGSPQSFTIAADTVISAAVFVCDATSTYTNRKIRIMLNTGSTALPYEPYGWKIPITCAGVTTPVYLGQTVTTRKIRKLVLDGTESWYKNEAVSRENTSYFYTTKITDNAGDVGGYCTHFVYDSGSYSHDYEGFSVLSGYGALRIRISNSIGATVADFKSYLAQQYAAGTPVTIWYVLATPETAIVNEPLCKIGDYADELRSTDAGVTIPTVRGSNTLTVDTELPPSAVSVTGHIKPS